MNNPMAFVFLSTVISGGALIACGDSASDSENNESAGGSTASSQGGANGDTSSNQGDSSETVEPSGGTTGDQDGPGPRRVVGYLPTYRSLSPAGIDFDTLTHLCLAFANPTGNGSESDFEESARSQIGPLVEAAHAKGVKVLASIAGGSQKSGDLVGAQLTPDKVDAYVASLVQLLTRYDLDGIDNDIEGDAVNQNYETFVIKLRAALPGDTLLTAAVATKNGDPVSDAALAEYDFLNIMAYDHCSWTDEACDQASIEGVREDLEYWTVTRGYPRRKAVLGVPFYGWCWGCSDKQSAITYGQVLSSYPQAKTEDWIVNGNVTISLNSAATIAKKAQLGHEYGGLMIWELGQDASGDDSLMKVVADAQ